jgi:acyl transferase domain-containing protein
VRRQLLGCVKLPRLCCGWHDVAGRSLPDIRRGREWVQPCRGLRRRGPQETGRRGARRGRRALCGERLRREAGRQECQPDSVRNYQSIGDVILLVTRFVRVIFCRPNGRAQQELIQTALRDARLSPEDVQLLETHGTGTKLGDPVEAAALAAVFGTRPASVSPLLLTAVKANVGHLEAGAGVAGLFSIILALQHGTAPPNALLRTLNKEVRDAIDGASLLPITAATQLSRTGSQRLVAGVSSFGYSGTIAHVLLQEPPEGVRTRSPAVLPPVTVAAPPFAEPAAADVNAAVAAAFSTPIKVDSGDCDVSDAAAEQVWQFAGQGDIRVGAGKELYETEVAFRSAMDECDAIVRPYLGRTISDMLYPPGCEDAGAPSPKTGDATAMKSAVMLKAEGVLAQTLNAQVALVALEYCLATVWLAQDVTPDIVLGHSLGKFAWLQ